MGRFNLADHVQVAQPSLTRDIETITDEILDAKRAGGDAILAIGKGLIEAKALLPHGEWLPWLEERVEFSERTARNFMRLARDWTNRQTLADLGASKALQLLALPESERAIFLNELHEVNGEEKAVIDMSARELAQAIKERDEALRAAAQAQADQRAADEAREKMAQDMALANGRIDGLNDLVERYSAEARERQEALVQVTAELAELKARPVEVAVQVDEEAVEAARKEAAEKTRAVVERELQTAKAAAQERVLRANKAEAQVRTELDQARRELEDLRFEAERAKKKAALTSDEDLVLFRTLFDQVQEQVNKLGGVLMKVRDRDPDHWRERVKGRGVLKVDAGTEVWILERDACGEPCGVSGYMFLAEVGNFVILTAYINDLECLEETMAYHAEGTAENRDTALAVFPVGDCFTTREDAYTALGAHREDPGEA